MINKTNDSKINTQTNGESKESIGIAEPKELFSVVESSKQSLVSVEPFSILN
jgi:hypothetical protein